MLHKYFYFSTLIFVLSNFMVLQQENKDIEIPDLVNTELEASIKRGKKVYSKNCASCHLPSGQGIKGAFPPLAKSDYLMADKQRSIRQVIYGFKGKMVVNGETYHLEMPAQKLTNQEVADVLNYVRNTWGNKGAIVTVSEVRKERR